MTEPLQRATALPEDSVTDRYEILRVLHVDAGGVVYLAWDPQLELQVAITEYLPAGLASRDAAWHVAAGDPADAEVFSLGLQAFLDEARRLAHGTSASLRVWRSWQQYGTAYMVRSLVDGLPLVMRLQELDGPPDEPWLLRLVDRLIGALDAREPAQPYLGDIVPDAIWLGDAGQVALLDGTGPVPDVIAGMRPGFGVRMLPPGYAAPEAYRRGTRWPHTEAQDVYAMAAVLRFAITGRAPPPAPQRLERDDGVPLLTLRKDRYGERFLDAIDRAWRLRPDERTRTLAAFRAELGLAPASERSARQASRWDDPSVLFEGDMSVPSSLRALPAELDAPVSAGLEAPKPSAAPKSLDELFGLDGAASSASRADFLRARPAPAAEPGPAASDPLAAAFRPPTPASTPKADDAPAPLMFGASAPPSCAAGSEFSVVFMAYIDAAKATAVRQVQALVGPSHHQVLDITPDGPELWREGTPFTVRMSGRSFRVEPAEQTFAWSGRKNILAFAVRALPDAAGPAVVSVLVLVEGIVIASLPLHIAISEEATTPAPVHDAALRAPRTVFASYASKDASDVAGRLSTLTRWAPSLDIFQDCLDLRPNEAYKPQLSTQIAARDAFLLFWSRNAASSNWVRWEFETALATKPRDAILPMPLEDPAIAPPPPELDDVHFRDRFMLAGYALRAIEQERRAPH